MWQTTRSVKHLAMVLHSRFISVVPTLNTACDPSGIKEAPILDNERIMDLPEEAKVKNNLEDTICVPVMVDLTPVNGIPKDYLLNRMVRIFQPCKNVMQSGTNNIRHWELEFDNRLRWENPLMGWTSSADPLSSLKMRFREPGEAIAYCERHGWTWYLDVPRPEREFRHKEYAWNFSWNKRTRTSTK